MARRKRGANGEGGLTRVGDRWLGRYTVHTPDGPKRRSVSDKNRARAAAKLREAIAAREAGSLGSFEARKLTVGEYVKRWLEDSARPSVAPRTYTSYEQEVRLRIVPILGDVPLSRLTPAHVEFFKNRLLERLAPSTVTQTLRVFATAMNQAVAWELIAKSPTRNVRRPKPTKEEMRCLTEEEASRLIQVAEGTPEEALYLVALKCGLRLGELAGLRWEDVNLDRGTLTVSRSVFVLHGTPRWGPTKTGEERVIALGAKLVEALRRHYRMQLEARLSAPLGWENARLVFPNWQGGVRTHSTILKGLQKHLRAAGLPRMRFHDLRDSAATLQLQAGTPVHVVAQILGHRDPSITLRTYAHVLPSMQVLAAKATDSYSF